MEQVRLESPPFRDGTDAKPIKVALILNSGGIGDYIHWIGAIKYVIDTNPHIYGYVLAPPFFYDLADLWLSKYNERFEVKSYETLDKDNPIVKDCSIVMPDRNQLANACGFHLTDVGFVYYTQRNWVIEEYKTIPSIGGNEAEISKFNLPAKYAVIPTEATADNRTLPPETINEVTKYIAEKGLIPVFLGKSYLAPDHIAKAGEGIQTEGVIDLREKTSLREAACIMAKAKFVMGMDGGLLHLASCSNVPVAFIFTTVHPDYRIPQRPFKSTTYSITPNEDLKCRFCNTGEPGKKNMSYLIGHDFKNCLYKDNLCTKRIDVHTLKKVIDQILEEKDGA